MELTISDDETKELLAEVISEMLVQKREIFQEIIIEAIEDAGLVNAVREGRANDFVSEDTINDILEGKNEGQI